VREGSSEHAQSARARVPATLPPGLGHASRGTTRVGFCSLRGHPKVTLRPYNEPAPSRDSVDRGIYAASRAAVRDRMTR
jgi:hypothetical protein